MTPGEAVTQIEALTVEKDEILVIRIPYSDWPENMEPDSFMNEVSDALHAGPLRDRFVLFGGDVEFAKVKA